MEFRYKFPSPHSGILFLSVAVLFAIIQVVFDRFRPLIRGFFFYVTIYPYYRGQFKAVSVPSFGDSFFMLKSPNYKQRGY